MDLRIAFTSKPIRSAGKAYQDENLVPLPLSYSALPGFHRHRLDMRLKAICNILTVYVPANTSPHKPGCRKASFAPGPSPKAAIGCMSPTFAPESPNLTPQTLQRSKQAIRSCFDLFEMFFEVKKSSFSSRFFSQIAPLSSLEEAVEPEVFHSQPSARTESNRACSGPSPKPCVKEVK